MDRAGTTMSSPLPQPPQPRRKGGGGTRSWLVVSGSSGKSHVEDVGKNPIMRRTGLPARDLRILDPVLSYPSTILGRERAIVVNLEHIKAIITATEVLVLNFKDPSVTPFVRDLEGKVSANCASPRPCSQPTDQGSDNDIEEANKPGATWKSTKISVSGEEALQHLRKLSSENPNNVIGLQMGGTAKDDNDMVDVPKIVEPKVLPFEFKALEVCLESACKCLETETSTLEQEAYPALDELTSKISTLNLQHARLIKSRLVALSGRVQKVRDELENLLDDDMDMAEMYLTDKLVHHLESDALEVATKDDRIHNDVAFETDGESNDNDLESNQSSYGNITGFKPNVEELEMLLEAYFAQIEGTLNKLSTMREYVDDTEDYINIMLDDKQNQLLQMGVLLSTATLLCNAAIVVVGLFGMNIHIELFDPGATEDPERPSSVKFVQTIVGSVGGCLILYFISIYCGKKRRLLE